MKGLSSKEQDCTEVPKTILNTQGSSLKVRKSFALLGLALSVGTVGALVNQQNSKDLHVTPVAQSPQTLADVLSQNKEHKYEMARAAIASGTWDKHTGVVVHEVRKDETLYKLTQLYQVDAAAIATSNGISAATPLQPGMKLVVPPVSGIIHKVKSGDTLDSIAKFYKVPKTDIIKYTALKSPELIAVDQPLVIPGNVASLMKVREDDARLKLTAKRDRLLDRLQEVKGKEVLVSQSTSTLKKQPKFVTYKVRRGDTIEAIAKNYGVSQNLIANYNKLDNLNWLELGKELRIPSGKDTTSMQMVAYNSEKPAKVVFSSIGSIDEQPANSSKTKVGKLKSELAPKDESDRTEVIAIQVKAATPMVIPVRNSTVTDPSASNQTIQMQANLPSPLDGLMQLAGSSVPKNMPNQAPLEQIAAARHAFEETPVLPVETESALKTVASLFPFTPDKLVEQHAASVRVSKIIPSVQPAQEPSVQASKHTSVKISKLAIAPSIQSFGRIERSEQRTGSSHELDLFTKPTNPVASPAPSQSVAKPSVDVTKLAVAPSIQSFDVVEQQLAKEQPAESRQPAKEPTVQLPKLTKQAVPALPSTGIIEQKIAARELTSEFSSNLSMPELPAKQSKTSVSFTVPKDPTKAIEQATTTSVKPTDLALLPESEARMTSLEMRRLELEINRLNDKVKKAEAEATRQAEEFKRAEATKIAAANINPSSNSFDSREAIANTGKASPLAPELPELVAKAYLPDSSGYGISTGFVWPAQGTLTSGFGWRWGRVHQGIDIAGPTGTPILAAAAGTVEYAAWNDGGYGNMVDIRHDDGTVTRYAHLNAILVKQGQPVNQSQLIAEMGSTGFSTGPHLHFEIRPNGGRAVDPMAFFARR